MKNIIILAAFMFHAVGAAAQKENTDTLFNASKVGKVVIVDGADGLTVKTMANDSTVMFDYHKSYGDNVKVKSHKSEYSEMETPTFLPAIELTKCRERNWHYAMYCNFHNSGFITGLSMPDGMKIDTWQSREISWLEMLMLSIEHKNMKNAFRVGLGLTWRSYCMTDGNRFVQDNGIVSVAPFSPDVEYDYSQLKVFSLSVPILWMHWLSKTHAIKLGPVVNFNTYSSMKTKYNDGCRDVEEFMKIQGRVPVTVDFYGSFRLSRYIGLYVRYSPCNVFKTGTAPQIKPLSFGLTLGF